MHVHANTYQTKSVNVTLSSGITNTVNFSLNSNPATLQGTVTAAGSGDPLPSTLVEVHINNLTVDSTFTDSLGNYMLTGLSTGVVPVHAHNDAYQSGLVNTTLEENMTTVVNFSLASDPSVVNGTIRDATTGLPISSAFVFISVNGQVFETTLTLSNGTYSIGGLFPDTFTVSAQKSGYISNSTSLIVSSGGETLTKNLSLYLIDLPPTNLTGEVLLNRFLLQVDRIHQLNWQPSINPEVVAYRIYRNNIAIDNFVASIRPLTYDDHNRSANITDIYVITSINTDGSESSGSSVSLK